MSYEFSYKFTFTDGSESYLMHHGIKGQKWGVIRKAYVPRGIRRTKLQMQGINSARQQRKISRLKAEQRKAEAKYKKIQDRVERRRNNNLFRALKYGQDARVSAWERADGDGRQVFFKPVKKIRADLVSESIRRDRIKSDRIQNGFVWEQNAKRKQMKKINKAKKKLAKMQNKYARK